MRTLTPIPLIVLAISFLLTLAWFRKPAGRLLAHYRLLVVAMSLPGLAVIGMALTNPNVGL